MKLDVLKSRFMDLTGDAVAVGFIAPDANTAVMQYVNAAFTRQFGYTPADILGRKADRIHDPDTWQDFTSRVRSAFEAGAKQFSTDAAMVRADGSKFCASVNFIVVPDSESGGRFVCATYRDISQLKEAEATARNANERLIAALDAYPDPIVIYDKGLRLVCCNQAYEVSMGAQPGSLQGGMHLTDVLRMAARHGRFPAAVGREEDWIADITSQEALGFEWQDIELDGDTHYRVLRSRSSNGDYVVIRLNSTEFVRQQRDAEAARARLVAAMNAYPAPFAIYDPQDCLVAWNDAYDASMTPVTGQLRAGMHREEVANIAICSGKIVQAVGKEDEWMSGPHQESDMAKPVQDLELPGDVHHRLLRSRAENGDLVLLRIDTTELVRQRRALQESQDRLISAINAYPDPFAIYDADQNLLIWNPAYARSMTDDPEKLRPGINLKTLLLDVARAGRVPQAIKNPEQWVEAYYSPDLLSPGTEDFEFSEDQHFRMVRSRSENGELVVLRLNITEVVRSKRAAEEYARELEAANRATMHKAYHDELTGLGNRRHLAARFDALVERRGQVGGEIVALHIDLDRFKQINDTMGHAAGDAVLQDASGRIAALVGPEDTVARIGGDEFVVLLHVLEEADRPETLACALLRALSEPTCFEGKECRYGASIGMARTPLSDTDELLTNSDVALFKAKRRGRGQLGIFDRLDLEELRANKSLADDILRGIEHGEFVPYYQPQVDARTGAIVGLEALARWTHPKQGVLTPQAFLQVATDLNVAADIDRMIFERAIDECGAFFCTDAHPPSLSFNVSANRVNAENFDAIAGRIGDYAGQVCFELLETIFLEEKSEAFLFQLDRLREIGIGLEVDDFGSGRASVVALQRIGPDRLKIDRRLIGPIAQCEKAHRLLRSIVDIGLALEMGVTAEGVETVEQAKILTGMGCDRLQGYLFAKPLSFDALTQGPFGHLRQTASRA